MPHAQEALIAAESTARNHLEAFLFEMRSALAGRFGSSMDTAKTTTDLAAVEVWLYDFGDVVGDADRISQYEAKLAELKASINSHSGGYFEAVAAEKARVEGELAASAAARAEEEGDDADHDDRKLKKADRMRLVVKNKVCAHRGVGL